MAARVVATREGKSQAQIDWLHQQAREHDDTLDNYEVSDMFTMGSQVNANNDYRRLKKEQRIETIRQHIEDMEPGTRFIADDIEGWWANAKEVGDPIRTTAVIRRDVVTLVKDGFLHQHADRFNRGQFYFVRA